MPDMEWWSNRQAVLKDTKRSTARDARSEFERDRSRILHSRAFRRLQAKTQVFPPSKKDFYRTRLTHSLECAQIGKALALRLWKEALEEGGSDLVEAACLAHDIGHPPCGHRGEEAIREAGVSFDGNAQNIRVLSLLEEKVLGTGEENLGLNLTKATLASIMKYPYAEEGRKSEFLYNEDVERLPLPKLFEGSPFKLLKNDEKNATRPFPLLLMEWADDVAYSTHDTEDGINAGFITPTHLLDELYRDGVTIRVGRKLPSIAETTITSHVDAFADELLDQLKKCGAEPPAHKVKAILDERIDRFVDRVEREKTGEDWLYSHQLIVPEEIRIECEFLKALARECVFRDPRVTRLEFKQKRIIRELFGILLKDCSADGAPQLFPRSWWETIARAKEAGRQAEKRLVSDYLSGMSDVHCMQMYTLLYDSESGSAFVTA